MMQEPASRSTSTLELVVNEQQLQNMSQIDLSRPGDQQQQQRQQHHHHQGFSFQALKSWPGRCCESFRAKIDEAKAKSETKCDFVFAILHEFSAIIIWVLCLIFTTILPVFLLLVGLINLDNCQARPALPYLIFSTGFLMTASNLFNLAYTLDFPILTNHQILSNDVKNIIASIINIMFNCFVAFLYIVSAYMVYTMPQSSVKPPPTLAAQNATEPPVAEANATDGGPNCSPLLYQLSFWFITLTLGSFVVLAKMASIFYAYNQYRLAIIRGTTPRSHTTPTPGSNITINTDPFATTTTATTATTTTNRL